MRWPPQPPVEQFPRLQPQQPQGLPASCWPPCPPHHVVYNPFMQPAEHPEMMPMLSPPQYLPPVTAPGERSPWFQTLVAAVSRSIQDDGKSALVDVIDIDQEDMSSEDEKTLIDALKKWKDGELRMPEVFQTLGKKNGHTELEWKTWFITHFEELNSKVNLTPNTPERSPGDTHAPARSSEGTSRTRSESRRWTSRPSSITLVDERTRSRDQAAVFNPEMEILGSENLRRGSTSRNRRSASRVSENGKALPSRTRVRSRAGHLPAPVTPEDLRAMAQYLFENGDTSVEVRRYRSTRWREFAERPENRKRSSEGWACIPRLRPKHAAEIERYVREFQEDAEAAKSTRAVPAKAPSPAGELPC